MNLTIRINDQSLSVEMEGLPQAVAPVVPAVPAELKAVAAAPSLEWSDTLCDGESVAYEAAEKAIAALGDGWRMPSIKELQSLVDHGRHDPCIDTEKFPDTKSSYYWSSTPTAWNTSAVWIVDFDYGNSYYGARRNSLACVRAVRSSQ